MKNSSFFDFDKCFLSNELWPNFINEIGIFKAQLAFHQALDLQRMQGSKSTLPVLILEIPSAWPPDPCLILEKCLAYVVVPPFKPNCPPGTCPVLAI